MPGAVVLLAAGASRRFGSDKRTHPIPGGTTLLHASTQKYVDCFEQVIVVIRHGDAALADALATRFGAHALRIVTADHAELGMGHSLAAGIAAAEDCDYAFIALADMPFVETTTLARLKQAMETAASDVIIHPSFDGQPGHPVGFGHDHFDALRTLTGDAGARSIVKNSRDQVVDVPVADRGVLHDIDRPADLDP